MDDFELPGGDGRHSEASDVDEEGRRRWRGMFPSTRREGRANTVSDGVLQPVSGRPQGFSSSSQTIPALYGTRQAMACPSTFEPLSQSRQSQEVPSLMAERDEKHLPFGDESSFEALQRDPEFIQRQQAIMDQIMVDRSQSHQSVLPENRSRASIVSNERRSRTASIRFHGRQEESTLNDYTKAAWNDTSQESSDDFLQYLNDPDVVEEQRRIMENIRSEASQSRTGHSASSYYESSSLTSDNRQGMSSFSTFSSSVHSSSTRRVNDEMLGYMEEAASCMSLPPPRQEQDDELLIIPAVRSVSEPNVPTEPKMPPMTRRSFSETLSRSPMTSMTTASRVDEKDARRPYTTQCEQDALVELYQGKKIQVRGTNHTWKSIAKGKATLVQCPVCFTILQVGSTAKLLFCTKCNEVSPVGIHDSSMDYRADGLIAVVVQQQEVDVALAKKMARNAANK